MREVYRRLTTENKRPGPVALTAITRRMLVILNAIARDNQPWSGTVAVEQGLAKATVQSQASASPCSTAQMAPSDVPSRDEIQQEMAAEITAHRETRPHHAAVTQSSRYEIQEQPPRRGRKPKGQQAMTGAERQACPCEGGGALPRPCERRNQCRSATCPRATRETLQAHAPETMACGIRRINSADRRVRSMV